MATFDDAALSKLTARIESKLVEPKKTQGKKDQGKKEKDQGKKDKDQGKKDLGKRKRDQTTETTQPPPTKKNNTSKSNGNKNNVKSKNPKPNVAPAKDTSNALLDEIRALGGDEEDLKLVEDVNSEDEEIDHGKKKHTDKDLRAELTKFAAGLGFDNVRPESGTEESDDDMDGADDVDEDEEDEDEDDASEPNADEKLLRDPKRKTVS